MLDTDTGEVVERRLENENEEARTFYTALVFARALMKSLNAFPAVSNAARRP